LQTQHDSKLNGSLQRVRSSGSVKQPS
jgi:hypothetical protein